MKRRSRKSKAQNKYSLLNTEEDSEDGAEENVHKPEKEKPKQDSNSEPQASSFDDSSWRVAGKAGKKKGKEKPKHDPNLEPQTSSFKDDTWAVASGKKRGKKAQLKQERECQRPQPQKWVESEAGSSEMRLPLQRTAWTIPSMEFTSNESTTCGPSVTKGVENTQQEHRRTHQVPCDQQAGSGGGDDDTPEPQNRRHKAVWGVSSNKPAFGQSSRICQIDEGPSTSNAAPLHQEETQPNMQVVPLAHPTHYEINQMRLKQEREQIEKDFSNMQITQPRKTIIRGKRGHPIKVLSNHLSLNIGSLEAAYHYDVTISPDVPKLVLPIVFELFRQKNFPNRFPAFDGRKNMYTATEMPWSRFSGEITVPVEGIEKVFLIEIKYACFVNLTPLHNLTADRQSPTAALAVIDIVLRHAASKNCCVVGRSFFTKPPSIMDLGNGMEMYQGFYQSAIRGGKLLLNVDVAHKAFPKTQSVIHAIENVCASPGQQFSFHKPLTQYQIALFQRYIKNLKILYEIPGQVCSKRFYRVNGVDEPSKIKTFNCGTGTCTVESYFRSEKGYTIKYPMMPTIWVGSKSRQTKILLPPECCTVVRNQALNRKMNDAQTTQMIRHATTDTITRMNKIKSCVTTANYNADQVVKEFGFSVGSTFQQVEGRVLEPPKLLYVNKDNTRNVVSVSKGVWGTWPQDIGGFLVPATVRKWTIAYVDRVQPKELDVLAEKILHFGRKFGMNIREAKRPFQPVANTLPDLTQFFSKNMSYDIIFVVISNQSSSYSNVKKAAEINVGCLTQCIKSRTVTKITDQIVLNVLLKVNSKLTGINHSLASSPPILSKPCMIMGADVTHPSPDSMNTPSVAAVVASHEPKAFRYNICWRLQKPKEEVITDLKQIAIEQIMFFYKKNNGQKPHRIMFFRDGVSEGQFNIIHNKEIRALQEACRELEQDYAPKITFVVVQKRHHTRLFPLNRCDAEDKNCNVPAGTCVDDIISNPCMQEFYLVSHASIQGVARPTKYCTLWDDNGFTNDDLEQLAYFLCHMFTRCNRSVSYPAPTYYAHLAAARTKVYIENRDLNMNDLDKELLNHTIKDRIRKEFPMFFV
ncbi:protein argonaute-2-like isoform X2 [Aethina tumida]|uniref:protein argonaute-2-like isoform X2 n=1 Tax=Aethina tumida TaxID=116153 RepID=UPI00214986D2|nr:protein argonaute-2-like isoform X2 [Aethina tumida]